MEGWVDGKNDNDGKNVAFVAQMGMNNNDHRTSGWDSQAQPSNNNPYHQWDAAGQNQQQGNNQSSSFNPFS